MALFEKGLTTGNVLTGLAIGVGVIVLAPVVLPALRPVAKAAIKGGIHLYDKGKESFSELGESMGDMVAEARSELAEQNSTNDVSVAAEEPSGETA